MERLRRRSDQGFIKYIPVFVAAAVAAGPLVALAALPLVGLTGLAAKAASERFQALPTELAEPLLPLRSIVQDKNGKQIATFYSENRQSVPLDKVASIMQQAVIAIEDERFYEHHGVDTRSLSRALFRNLTSDSAEGGSTLTMQYVRNILVEQAGNDADAVYAARKKDAARKMQEIRYAIDLETRLSKDKILEGYLNTVYFGDGTHGVEAAARHYFSTSAAKLTLEQAALLAGLLQAPARYDPTNEASLPTATARRNVVLSRMAELGMISQEQAAAAISTKVTLKITKANNGCYSARYALFCDYVHNILRNDPVFGETEEARKVLLETGGLTIRTTLDPTAQKAAENAIAEWVYPKDSVAAAIAMVQPGDGAVRALAQSKPFGEDRKKQQTVQNWAVDAKYGAGTGFQTGSTMKVFTTAAAFAEGFRGTHPIHAPHTLPVSRLATERSCDGDRVYPDWPDGDVNNETTEENRVYSLKDALAGSINTYFVQLTDQVGLCNVVKMAERAGVHRADGEPLLEHYSFTLGINEMSPLTMANAYATFAARGIRCDPYAIIKVTDRTGKPLEVPKSECRRTIDPGIADATTALMTGVMRSGTGAGVQLAQRPSAGKTGTTQNRVAAWFAGFTPQLSAAVWVGNPHEPEKHPMYDIKIGGVHYRQVYGGKIPGGIWKLAMDAALKGVPPVNFHPANPKYLYGPKVEVPDLTGMTYDEAKEALIDVGLNAKRAEKAVPSVARKGTVARTDPAATTKVVVGTTVTIYLSNGKPPIGPPEPPILPPLPIPPPPHGIDPPQGGDGNKGGGGGGPGLDGQGLPPPTGVMA